MRSTFKILFYLNTSKRKKSGSCPIMGRITVDGNIAQFSLKEDVHPDCWNAKKGLAMGKNREQTEINKKIEQTEQSIRDIYQKTVEKCGYVTAEQIRNELTGVTGKAETILKLFREHNEEFEKRIGIDRKYGTYHFYKNTFLHLSNFIRSKYGLEDYPLKQLNIAFINDFDFYLRVDAKLKTNTIIQHMINLKKIITRAINQGISLRDPFPEYEKPRWELRYMHISLEELEKVISIAIPAEEHKSVRFIRDMFVFSCFTGLAYSDVRQLSEKHLRKTPDGNTWIDIKRQKTGVESNIKLLQLPMSIIEKYRHERKGDLLFNMPSHSTVIYNLHKLEILCGIKHLHFHMARHTFATEVCLNNGIPLETISKMMGHSSIHTTQIYAEITSQKVVSDMKKLAERIKEKHVIN